MADESEFGGSPGLVQPATTPDGGPGHTPTASETLSGVVRTGTKDPRNPYDPRASKGQHTPVDPFF